MEDLGDRLANSPKIVGRGFLFEYAFNYTGVISNLYPFAPDS
jgi:hypothetical protein